MDRVQIATLSVIQGNYLNNCELQKLNQSVEIQPEGIFKHVYESALKDLSEREYSDYKLILKNDNYIVISCYKKVLEERISLIVHQISYDGLQKEELKVKCEQLYGLMQECQGLFRLQTLQQFTGRDNKFHFIETQEIIGCLKDLINAFGQLNFFSFLVYSLQIISGLQDLHVNGVYLQNLKMETIFLTKSSNLTIGDFSDAVNLLKNDSNKILNLRENIIYTNQQSLSQQQLQMVDKKLLGQVLSKMIELNHLQREYELQVKSQIEILLDEYQNPSSSLESIINIFFQSQQKVKSEQDHINILNNPNQSISDLYSSYQSLIISHQEDKQSEEFHILGAQGTDDTVLLFIFFINKIIFNQNQTEKIDKSEFFKQDKDTSLTKFNKFFQKHKLNIEWNPRNNYYNKQNKYFFKTTNDQVNSFYTIKEDLKFPNNVFSSQATKFKGKYILQQKEETFFKNLQNYHKLKEIIAFDDNCYQECESMIQEYEKLQEGDKINFD